MVEYNLNYTVVNFQIPQAHISSSFENKLKCYVHNRNVVLIWEWQVNIAKVRANNNLNPVFIFFRNLWRNAHRSVVVCCLLTARNAKLAVLPQNFTLASTPSAPSPVLLHLVAVSRDPVVTRGQGRRESLFSRFRLHCARNRNHNGRALPTPRRLVTDFCLRRRRNSHCDFQVHLLLLVFATLSSSDPYLICR